MKIGWYKDSFRRNLVDMHIEDWNDEFLSEFSPEAYCENLKRGRIRSAMIYLQNHNGHCYFPTKVGHVHKAFEKDNDVNKVNKIKRLTELCHENGIDVIGYYSLIFNTYEEDRHPEWKLLMTEDRSWRDMGSRYGLCCPNNREYVAFVKTQISEMLEYFDLDGMFFDMTFWPFFCHCEHCRRRLFEETGMKDFPVDLNIMAPNDMTDAYATQRFSDEGTMLHYRKRIEWIGKFAREISDYTRSLQPGITIEHNYAKAMSTAEACSTELVNDACDYCGGDLYGNLYNHSFAAKYFRGISQNQPFEYMTCRCDNNLNQHTVTKSESHLELEVMLNASHHAATFIIDAIDPKGTMDSRVYDRIGKIFDKMIPYERYFKGTPLSDVAILYSTVGRYNRAGQAFDSKSCSVSASETLAAYNVAYDVIPRGKDILSEYKCVIAGGVAGLDPIDIAGLESYVREGGNLYFSGVEEPELLVRFFNAEYLGMSDYSLAYIAPKKSAKRIFDEFDRDFPLPTKYRMPIVKVKDSSLVAAYITYPYTRPDERRLESIHSNQPGIATRNPAMLIKAYGKGKVVWSGTPIEEDNREAFRRIFSNIVEFLLPKKERQLISTAPKQVELISHRDGDAIQISAIDLLCTDEMLTLPAFSIKVRSELAPKRIKLLPDGREVRFTYKDGWTSFRVNGLKLMKMFRIEF